MAAQGVRPWHTLSFVGCWYTQLTPTNWPKSATYRTNPNNWHTGCNRLPITSVNRSSTMRRWQARYEIRITAIRQQWLLNVLVSSSTPIVARVA